MAFIIDTSVFSHWTATKKKRPRVIARVDGVLASEGRLVLPYVAHFEILRGLKDLLRRGQGKKQHARYLLLMEFALAFVGLDGGEGQGWRLAAELHVRARAAGITISDSDLLIVATAIANQRKLLTCDARLARNLDLIQLADAVELLPTA